MTPDSEPTRGHPEDKCQRCCGDNPVWFAPNELWNEFAGRFSILCPICFVELVEVKIKDRAWQLQMEPEINWQQRAEELQTELTHVKIEAVRASANYREQKQRAERLERELVGYKTFDSPKMQKRCEQWWATNSITGLFDAKNEMELKAAFCCGWNWRTDGPKPENTCGLDDARKEAV